MLRSFVFVFGIGGDCKNLWFCKEIYPIELKSKIFKNILIRFDIGYQVFFELLIVNIYE